MMVIHNDSLLFLSCNPHREEIDKFKNNKEFVSIYRVCGIEPWLIVCKAASIRAILKLNQEYKLNIKYMSITSSPNLLGGKKLSDDKNQSISWIFIKGENLSSIGDFIKFLNEMNDFEITQAYQIFGEYNFILKIHTLDIGVVDRFLIRCHEEEISTSTKCVLTALKDESRLFENNIEEKKTEAAKIKRECPYAIARIMANTCGFIQKSKEEQKRWLKDKLNDIGIPAPPDGKIEENLLDPELEKNEYSQCDLVHPNDLIDRYSIKLERGGWLKVLLFFKATSGKKILLEETLIKKLLGVKSHQFSRKLYHMTGDYDFIVPFDCEDIGTLDTAINNFLREQGELIESFTNTVCHPGGGRGGGRLEVLDLPLIDALLINATQISSFERKVKDMYSPISNGEPIMAREGISPREGYVREQIGGFSSDSLADYKEGFTTFKDIGIESTIEFKGTALIQNLLKFYFANPDKKSKFLIEIKRKIDNYELMGVIYKPVRNPLTVMCILMVKKLAELEVLIDEFRAYCRKIEFHVIFHQKYYSKTIKASKVGCKPCFYPVDPSSQNCGNCIRYLLPRKRDRILNIDFKKKLKRNIKINLVGIDMNLSQYFALEKLLDREEKRKTIFENYKHFVETNPRSHYKSPDEVLNEYNEIIRDRRNYRNNYKNAILKVINSNDFDILLFPEYTIPSNIYKQIKEEIKQICMDKKCFIVAGTHIDKTGFNVCPVFITDEEKKKTCLYYLYKNNFSQVEEKLGLMENRGTAHLKFLNTVWGNLYLKTCYDVFSVAVQGEFKNVDVLLVPSFNISSEFIGSISNKAQDYKLVVGYANTTNEGGLETDFFYPPDQARRGSQIGVKPFHSELSKEEPLTQEHIFDVSELDEKQINGFDFRFKRIKFDIIQLDRRRKISTMGES